MRGQWAGGQSSRLPEWFFFARLWLRGEQAADEIRRLIIVLGQRVCVQVHGEGCRRVTEAMPDRLDVHAACREL